MRRIIGIGACCLVVFACGSDDSSGGSGGGGGTPSGGAGGSTTGGSGGSVGGSGGAAGTPSGGTGGGSAGTDAGVGGAGGAAGADASSGGSGGSGGVDAWCDAACQKASTLTSCSGTSEHCTICKSNAAQHPGCLVEYAAVIQCLAEKGTPACTAGGPFLNPGAQCDGAVAALQQCDSGSGGGGGSGGSGGSGGAGGSGGTGGSGGSGGGSGGTGGTCAAPPNPTNPSCIDNGGPALKLTGATSMVALVYTTGGATPGPCGASSSKVQVFGTTVNLPQPSSAGCGMYRVCNYNPACTNDYSSPGIVFGICVNSVGQPTCTFQ